MNQLALFDLPDLPQQKRRSYSSPKKIKVGSLRKRHKDRQRKLFEERKSQKQQIVDALNNPMTINELYRALPHISPNNIAPLVTYLAHEGKIIKMDEKMDTTEKGIERKQVVWSARPEHVMKFGDSIVILNNIFGVKQRPPEEVKQLPQSANDH